MKGPLTESIINRFGRVILGTGLGGGMTLLLSAIGFFTGKVVFLYVEAPIISVMFWFPVITFAMLGSERAAPFIEILGDIIVGLLLCGVGAYFMPIAPISPTATHNKMVLTGVALSAVASVWGACIATPRKIRE